MTTLPLENSLYMYPDPSFPLSADSVQLAHFAAAHVRPGDRVLDAGCGAGAVMLLMAGTVPAASYVGVDIRPDAVALAALAAREQGLSMEALCADLRDLPSDFPRGFDLVVSNPPYFPLLRGKLPADEGARIARSEICLNLPQLITAAAERLRHRGSFCVVVRPERIADLMVLCRRAFLEPREMIPVCPRAGADAAFVLVRAVKGGKSGAFAMRVTSPGPSGHPPQRGGR